MSADNSLVRELEDLLRARGWFEGSPHAALTEIEHRVKRLLASISHWIDVGMQKPEPNRKLLVTNNPDARDAFGQPSHVWLIDLLQEMSHAPGYYCGYQGDELIQYITAWRYALPEAK